MKGEGPPKPSSTPEPRLKAEPLRPRSPEGDSPNGEPPLKDIGRRLEGRRRELGLSVEQVQAETKIRRRYLEALEAGREDLIPGEVYVKGFLRFYANFLGLDGSDLVAEYSRRKEAQTPASPTENEGAGRKRHRAAGPGGLLKAGRDGGDGRVGRLVILAAVILVLVALSALWYAWRGGEPAAGDQGGVAGTPPASAGSGVRTPGNEAVPAQPSPRLPSWAKTGESDRSVSYVVYGAPFTVGIEVVAEQCWVRVTADGELALERTLQAGAVGEWAAKTSVVIVLGRPQLVRVTLNGEPLGPAGSRDQPRTLDFRFAQPTGEGAGTGGESPGRTGSAGI